MSSTFRVPIDVDTVAPIVRIRCPEAAATAKVVGAEEGIPSCCVECEETFALRIVACVEPSGLQTLLLRRGVKG